MSFIVISLQVSAFRSVGMFSGHCSLTWAGMIQQNYTRTAKYMYTELTRNSLYTNDAQN